MAINPLLSLQVQGPDYSEGLNALQRGFENRALKKERDAERVREDERFAATQDLAQQRLDIAVRGLESEEQLRDIQRANAELDRIIKLGEISVSETNSIIKGSSDLVAFKDNVPGAHQYLTERLAAGERLGLDMKDTKEAIQILESGNPEQINQLFANAESMRQIGIERGLVDPMGGSEIPSDVRTAEWYRTATPEQKAAFDSTKRTIQPFQITSDGTVTQRPGFSEANAAVEGAEQGAKEKAGITPQAQKEANKDFMTGTYRPAVDAGATASEANARLEALQNIDIKTGWGTNAKASAANVLASFGLAPEAAETLAGDAQSFRAIVSKEVNEELMAQKGPQTEGDSQRAFNIQASLGNRPEANEFIIDMAKAVNKKKIEKAAFFKENLPEAVASGDLTELERMWAEKEKSIFEYPSMKKYSEGTKPAGEIKFLGFE